MGFRSLEEADAAYAELLAKLLGLELALAQVAVVAGGSARPRLLHARRELERQMEADPHVIPALLPARDQLDAVLARIDRETPDAA
jgi:hypothetical protein